jgi:hypothetical protein
MELAYVTLQAPKILSWLLDFWKICAALTVVYCCQINEQTEWTLDVEGRQEDGWMDGHTDRQTNI